MDPQCGQRFAAPLTLPQRAHTPSVTALALHAEQIDGDVFTS
jgi:hypothetical protein